jgi:phosphinothricin acetyltransferase
MIRRVRDEDAKRLVEIYNYYIKETEITLELSELTEAQYLDRIHQITSFYPWLVYEEEGKILGFAYLDKFNTRKAYATTADLSIYVDCKCKRKGIGKGLYKALEELGLSLGLCKIISLITTGNRASSGFHKAMGFKKLTAIKNVAYKHGKWVGVTFMEKSIQTIVEPTLNKDEPSYRESVK